MTSRKSRPRESQYSTVPQPSDYESDWPATDPTDALPSRSMQKSNPELNLSVLRRHLPSITSILSVAHYAVVYAFSPSAQNWEKSGIEGTLFVCQQSSAAGLERFSVVVLNRKGLNDFICPLSGEIDFENGYIILRSTDGSNEYGIWGLWVFEEEGSSTAGSRAMNAKTIQNCALRAANPASGQSYHSPNGYDGDPN
ncbi:MAG: hypothetical protein LQ352_003936 [Teloschistes flavicans]|nr:MAG: hypothetical protein LQ352_003936 [Teloschistes flavicans]